MVGHTFEYNAAVWKLKQIVQWANWAASSTSTPPV